MKTIYILENNTYLKQQISITLEKAGYETVFFSSADEFFSENKKHIADLLIIRTNSSNEDGMSVMHNIRQGGNSVPIIMIFSKNSSIEITKMLDSGADDCISIPFGTREFVSRLNAVLRRLIYSLQ